MAAPLRLADVLAGLSLIADLVVGAEPEKAMRTCLLAVSLAERADLTEEQTRDVYYAALLEHVGCSGGAHEAAMYFGDDIDMYHAAFAANLARPQEVVTTFIPEVARGRPLAGRLRVAAVVLSRRGEIGAEIRAAQYADRGGRLFVCPICFNACRLDAGNLAANARLAGATPLWEWIGEGATVFSF